MNAKFTRGPYQRDGRSIFKLVDNPEPKRGRPDQINLWLAGVSPCGIAVETAELEAVATLFQAAPLLYEALSGLEWSQSNHRCCPACGRSQGTGHFDDCKLNKALRAARGEG